VKENAHQGKPEERSRRFRDRSERVWRKDGRTTVSRDTSRPKPYPPSFLAELPRFDNSQNIEMRDGLSSCEPPAHSLSEVGSCVSRFEASDFAMNTRRS